MHYRIVLLVQIIRRLEGLLYSMLHTHRIMLELVEEPAMEEEEVIFKEITIHIWVHILVHHLILGITQLQLVQEHKLLQVIKSYWVLQMKIFLFLEEVYHLIMHLHVRNSY